MTHAEDHEAYVPTTAALVPVQGGSTLVQPVASYEQTVAAFEAYQALRGKLLTADDYQQSGRDRRFVKKSGWRKMAVAMGVSTVIVSVTHERNAAGRIIRSEVVARAVAPNGRFAEGLGACDLFERCCKEPCAKKTWKNHECCTSDCSGFHHFSHSQHDIPATAQTRATNRACSDLFGFGEVSAEEVIDDGEPAGQGGQVQSGARGRPGGDDDGGNMYQRAGWASGRDHNTARTNLMSELEKLPSEARRAFRDWRNEQGIDLTQLVTAEDMERLKIAAEQVANGERPTGVLAEGSPAGATADPIEGGASTDRGEVGEDPAGGQGAAAGAPPKADEEAADGAQGAAPLAAGAEEGDGVDRGEEQPCPVCLGGPNGVVDGECWGCDGTGFVTLTARAGIEAQLAEGDEPEQPPAKACAICGSTRAKLVEYHGVLRCEKANDCRERVEAKAAANVAAARG